MDLCKKSLKNMIHYGNQFITERFDYFGIRNTGAFSTFTCLEIMQVYFFPCCLMEICYREVTVLYIDPLIIY